LRSGRPVKADHGTDGDAASCRQGERAGAGGWLFVWSAGVLVLGLIVICLTFRDYGATWDEPVDAAYGELAVDYFRSGFKDTRVNSFLDLKFYNPFFEELAALACQFDCGSKYEIRHFFNALLALLTVPAVLAFGRYFGKNWLAFFSSLVLLLLPRFYGHAFNNSKDMPFACFFAWSLAAIAGLFLRRPDRFLPFAILGGVSGLAACARPGGLPILLFLFAATLIFTRLSAVLSGQGRFLSSSDLRPLLWGFAALALAWLVMVAGWPWALSSPLLNPLAAMSAAASFRQSYPVWFEGRSVMSNCLPWYYLCKYLLIATPPAVLIASLAGTFVCARNLLTAHGRSQSPLYLLTLLWFWCPILYFCLFRPNVYDEIRHFLFIQPALALLAGIGANWLIERISPGKWRKIALAAITIVFLVPVKDLVCLHPYQSTYFNALVGGVKNACRYYETDYWVSSYREAMQWINRQSELAGGRKLSVLVAGNGYCAPCAAYYRCPQMAVMSTPDLYIQGALPAPFDFYVASTRYHWHENFPESPVVHSVGRCGAVFTVIKARGGGGWQY
jgi:hypothetical protein